MDALSLNSLGLTTVNAVSPLRALQTTGSPKPNSSAQELNQGTFQRSLQAVAAYALAEPASGAASFAQEASASLLASLTAPQAAASVTPNSDATTNPTAVQAASSTAPTPTPPVTPAGDVPVSQDGFATSSSVDFPMQTALRFGAGVMGPAAPGQATPAQTTNLVRDATSVIQAGSIQARANGPGPEDFLRTQASLDRVLRDYKAATSAPTTSGVDLLA